MKVLHIFSYGEDQAIDINDGLNKKFNKNELLNHQAVIDMLNLQKDYSSIFFNGEFIFIDLSEKITPDAELLILINNLIDEILQK